MKASSETILGTLLQLRARLRGNGLPQQDAGDEPPLRSELFSSDQMEQHGKTLAGSHTLGLGRAPDQLLPRLAENEGVLIGACNLLTAALKATRRIAPAGEWLLAGTRNSRQQPACKPASEPGSALLCRIRFRWWTLVLALAW